MRDIIIIVLILTLVFGGGAWTQSYLEGVEYELTSILDELDNQIENNDLGHLDRVYEFDELWANSKVKWHILGNHQQIDDIEAEIKKFIKAYEFGDELESSMSIAAIKFRINDMHKGDELLLDNIL